MFDVDEKEYLDSNYVRRKDCEGYRRQQDDNIKKNAAEIIRLSTEFKYIMWGIGTVIAMLCPVVASAIYNMVH